MSAMLAIPPAKQMIIPNERWRIKYVRFVATRMFRMEKSVSVDLHKFSSIFSKEGDFVEAIHNALVMLGIEFTILEYAWISAFHHQHTPKESLERHIIDSL